jgi:hypothetical protein
MRLSCDKSDMRAPCGQSCVRRVLCSDHLLVMIVRNDRGYGQINWDNEMAPEIVETKAKAKKEADEAAELAMLGEHFD